MSTPAPPYTELNTSQPQHGDPIERPRPPLRRSSDDAPMLATEDAATTPPRFRINRREVGASSPTENRSRRLSTSLFRLTSQAQPQPRHNDPVQPTRARIRRLSDDAPMLAAEGSVTTPPPFSPNDRYDDVWTSPAEANRSPTSITEVPSRSMARGMNPFRRALRQEAGDDRREGQADEDVGGGGLPGIGLTKRVWRAMRPQTGNQGRQRISREDDDRAADDRSGFERISVHCSCGHRVQAWPGDCRSGCCGHFCVCGRRYWCR